MTAIPESAELALTEAVYAGETTFEAGYPALREAVQMRQKFLERPERSVEEWRTFIRTCVAREFVRRPPLIHHYEIPELRIYQVGRYRTRRARIVTKWLTRTETLEATCSR